MLGQRPRRRVGRFIALACGKSVIRLDAPIQNVGAMAGVEKPCPAIRPLSYPVTPWSVANGRAWASSRWY